MGASPWAGPPMRRCTTGWGRSSITAMGASTSGRWAGGPRVPTGVDYARQNLPLIVAGGRPNPNLTDGPQWGATLGNAVRVWRSGIGIDARGDLIYAAANDQTVGSLAQILIRAGAIRAMQLDINSYWVTFNSYARPDAGQPSALLSTHDAPDHALPVAGRPRLLCRLCALTAAAPQTCP